MNINLKKIVAFLISVIPLLKMYQIHIIFNGLSELLCFVLFIIFLIMHFGIKNKTNKLGNTYIRRNAIVLILLFFSSLLNIESLHFRSIIFMILVFFILFSLNNDCIDFKLYKKLYLSFAIICTVYIFLQFFFARFLNIFLPANVIPLEAKDLFDAERELRTFGVLRLQSFFSEPALYSYYILPIFIFILFKNNKRKNDYLLLCFFTVGVFLSTSSLGIMSIIISFIFWFYKKFKKNFIKAVMILLLVAPLFLFLISNNSYVSNSLNSIIFDTSSSSKLNTRYYNGFSLYEKLPNENKIFGVGIGNGIYAIEKNNIKTGYELAWGENNVEYYNNIASALIYGGLVAGIFFCLAQLTFLKSKSPPAVALSLVYFVVCFASSSFFNIIYIFYGANLLFFDRYMVLPEGGD